MASRPSLLGVAVIALFAVVALIAAIALLASFHRWRKRFVATRVTLAALLVVISCPLFLYLSYLSLTVSAYSPPKVLNQPNPLPASTWVYVPTRTQGAGEPNTIVAVDGRTGAIGWRWTLPDAPNNSLPITRPSAEADGVRYRAQVTTWQIDPPIDVRSTVYALGASDGRLLRTFTVDGAIDWLGASSWGQMPAVLGFRVGYDPSLPISFGALDLTSGQVLWRQTISDPLPAWIDLVAGPDALYGLFFDPSSGANALMALNPRTGVQLWRTPVDVPADFDLTDGQRVYALDIRGHVVAVRASDGTALWQNNFGGSATSFNLEVHGFALADGNFYLAAQLPGNVGDAHGHLIDPEAVYALDNATGSLRWIYRTASGDRGILAAGGGFVYLRADDGLHAIRASDGTRLRLQAAFGTERNTGPGGPQWDAPLDPVGPVVFNARFDALPASADRPGGCSAPCRVREDLYALSASTGVAYWRVPIGPVEDVVAHFG